MADRTEADAVREQCASSAALKHFEPTGAGNFAVVPEGFDIRSLEEFQEAPNRHQSRHYFVETASLAQYVNRFATDATMISADYDKAIIKAVIDGDTPETPSFQSHVATFSARHHETLKAWLAIDGKKMSQIEFGRFLEDRAKDVTEPDAATIMEVVMQFDSAKRVTFKSSQRLSDGMRQFQYVEENEARGAVTVPEFITIRCPIFRGLDPQSVRFMLRHRIDDGRLLFFVEMHNKDEVMREAFDRCLDAFRTDLENDRFIYVTG